MHLLLINPRNPVVSLHDKRNRWNKYRVWKPLGLLAVAGLTPPEWKVTVIDENVTTPDYSTLPRPDLVGLTAFTSQAPRAYALAAEFRARRVPVVMGGIHATACQMEAAARVDTVVTGEAESVWKRLLSDAARGDLKALYCGGQQEFERAPMARHDLLEKGYYFGSIQTTRGCPLDCSFCSVSAFNGRRYRRRAVASVIEEFEHIHEKHVLIVDDNLIGTRRDHIERSKELFRAMIDAKLGKRWFCQATINMADDEELLRLARQAGCIGVFIGFETTSDDGLIEVHKRYNLQRRRDYGDAVRRIQRHGITVAGSFIIGLDVDRRGIGAQIAETAHGYGLDFLNVLFLTPLPGTTLWEKMEEQGRIDLDRFPGDWQYYTLTLPVGRYQHLSREESFDEMAECMERFYSVRRIAQRVLRNFWQRREPVLTVAGNLSFRINSRLGRKTRHEFAASRERSECLGPMPATGGNGHVATPRPEPAKVEEMGRKKAEGGRKGVTATA